MMTRKIEGIVFPPTPRETEGRWLPERSRDLRKWPSPVLLTLPHDSLSVTCQEIAPDPVPFPTQSIAVFARQIGQRSIRGNPAERGGQHP
jgi:hypothetical protein